MAKEKEQGSLSIHSENIFPIIKKWLYSEHDIFIRELVSNAVDALNKRKLVDSEAKIDDFKVEIKINKKKSIIEVIDNGIGMSADEIKKYINQIAFSGAEDFVEKFKDKQANIIGHFGLGFYSAFMVADKVEIDSLSYQKGSEPALWECDGTTDYSLTKGKRKEVGTTIRLYVGEDNKEYLEDSKMQEILEKFCNFMEYPIMFDKKQVNQKEALWNRKPKDISDEEYKEFYKQLFKDWKDPLFWVHLNVDYPFDLKGILYFPKINNDLEIRNGAVKLYCRNVFVSDNLKQVIPDFLLLLRGGIDIPEIPLNVSRSFLQEDKQVKKISKYIIKKVADHFKDVFKNDRKKYEEYWKDINNFIKYGMLTEEDFSEALKDFVIFKSTNGDYITIQEYRERNKSDEKPQKIYYAASEDTQVSYIKMMVDQGIEVLYSDSVLDPHMFQHLESKFNDITFVRVDSEINDNLVKSNDEETDETGFTLSDKIKEIFTKSLNKDEIKVSYSKDEYKDFLKKYKHVADIINPYIETKDDMTYIKPYELPQNVRKELGRDVMKDILEKSYAPISVDVKSLKTDEIASMVVFNEQMRRFHEMNYLTSNNEFDMLSTHTLVVNNESPIVKKIIDLDSKGKADEVKLLTKYIHQLALIEQKKFDGKELREFIENANKIMKLIET